MELLGARGDQVHQVNVRMISNRRSGFHRLIWKTTNSAVLTDATPMRQFTRLLRRPSSVDARHEWTQTNESSAGWRLSDALLAVGSRIDARDESKWLHSNTKLSRRLAHPRENMMLVACAKDGDYPRRRLHDMKLRR